MKNKQEFIGLITNVALVVLVFCFIVAGLNIIGIYSLPAPIEKLLGTYDGNDNNTHVTSDSAYGLISFQDDVSFTPVYLSYENADSVLKSLKPASNYSHTMTVTHYFGEQERKEQFQVFRSNDVYSVQVFDAYGNKIKTISENNDMITVTENYYGSDNVVNLVKGDFAISDECGFVLTADEFVKSEYNLTDADFVQEYRDGGSYITVSFDVADREYKTHNIYEISLDFGVVTKVLCYENDTLVYQMVTENIG